jgi:alanine racemase
MGAVAERVWAEIDLDALRQNLRYAQVRVGTSVGILAVVKSDAYGHGAVEVAHAIEAAGVKGFGVATPAEGIELRDAGITLPILILGSCFEDEIGPALERGLAFSLSPGEILRPIAETARKAGRTATVHLLVDTGMSRDGLPPEQAVELAEQVADTPELALAGTYTHLATSSQPDKTFCHRQLDEFNAVIRELLARNIHPGVVHCASTGGLLTLPCSHFDMVRQGISLYGLAPSPHVAEGADLAPVLSLKTRVMAVREIEPGQSVGYGRTFVAERPKRVATLSMGYADGFRLVLSGKGCVLVHGRRAPVLGRVMMDCTVVDVTSHPGVRAGDEATVIGRSGRRRITAADLAALTGSSPYEVLCSLGRRVRRVYVRDGRRVLAPGPNRLPQREASRIPRPTDAPTP